MKCPYCEKEMELGYIQCRDGVSWSRKKRAVAALSSLVNEIPLATGGGAFSGAAVEAYRCAGCQKIVIDYGQK